MNRIVWILRKEISRFFSDRTGALMTVLMPVILASLLGVIFAPRKGSSAIDLLIVDQDGGPAVRKLVEALKKDEALVVQEVDEAAARGRLKSGRSSVALLIPAGSSASLRPSAMFLDQKGQAQLLFDPSREIAVNIAEGLITRTLMEQVASQLGQPQTIVDMLGEFRAEVAKSASTDPVAVGWLAFLDLGTGLVNQGLPGPKPAAAPTATVSDPNAAAAPAGAGAASETADPNAATTNPVGLQGGLQPPLQLKRDAVLATGASAGFNSYAHNFAGMLCMFLLFLSQDIARALLWERSEGLLSRLRLAPAGRGHILIGMGLSAALLSVAVSAVVYAVGMLVFRITIEGPLIGFLAVILGNAVFIGGFALGLAGLSRTEQQMANLATFVILIMSFLGGAWFPSFLLPDWIQSVATLIPTHWATEGLAAMTWRGLPLIAGLIPAGILAGFGLVLGGLGIRAFRWE